MGILVYSSQNVCKSSRRRDPEQGTKSRDCEVVSVRSLRSITAQRPRLTAERRLDNPTLSSDLESFGGPCLGMWWSKLLPLVPQSMTLFPSIAKSASSTPQITRLFVSQARTSSFTTKHIHHQLNLLRYIHPLHLINNDVSTSILLVPGDLKTPACEALTDSWQKFTQNLLIIKPSR